MGKKGLTSILYKIRDVPRSSWASSATHYYLCYPPPPSSWPWPSCKHPRTSSFRVRGGDGDGGADTIYKTVNTVYDASSEYFFRRSSLEEHDRPSCCFSAVPAGEQVEEEEEQLQETVVRGMRSDRLFFDPGSTSSILVEKTKSTVPKKETAAVLNESTVVVTVESEDPYGDFKASMAEMVAAHGLRDWEGLEELLAWYLKLNGKKNHGVIVGAFVDLLVSLTSSSPSSSSSCITFEESCVTFEESG